MAATREPFAELHQTAVYETPVKTLALTPVAPLRRLQSVGLTSVGPHSACKSPAEEAALLRTVSSVMKEHMHTVQRAASLGSDEEYTHAKEAAAADLATLQRQLTGGEVEPGCEGVVARRYWPENAVLRRDVAVFFSELSDMVASELSSMVELPDATSLKVSLFSWASDAMASTTTSISRALEAAAPVIVLAKTVVSDSALAEAQSALAQGQMTSESVENVNEASMQLPLEPLHEELVAPMESAEPAVPLVEEVTYEEAELTVTVPVKTPSRNSLARFLRRLLLLSALGAGAAAAVHHREAIAGEVKKRVAQLQAMRPKAPREVSAEDSPAPVEQPAAAATVEAPAQPAAVPGAAL